MASLSTKFGSIADDVERGVRMFANGLKCGHFKQLAVMKSKDQCIQSLVWPYGELALLVCKRNGITTCRHLRASSRYISTHTHTLSVFHKRSK